MTTTRHVLTAKGLAKSYKRPVVHDFSIEIASAEIVGLLGPNGAGKTTSFYMMVGLVSADKGQVFFDNEDITIAPMHIRSRLGMSYLPQEPSVFRKLTVENNILAILQLRAELDKAERQAKLEQLLAEFGLLHLLSLIHI